MVEEQKVDRVEGLVYRFVLDEQQYVLKVGRDLRINRDDLDGAFVHQAGLYAYYSALYRAAETELERCGNQLSRASASARRTVREANPDLKTEKAIDDRASGQKSVMALEEEHSRLSQIRGTLKSFVEAFQQRRDMLQKLGVRRREDNMDFEHEQPLSTKSRLD